MNFFHALPTQNTCIDIDITTNITPIPYPNPNPNQPSSSSSLSYQFFVEFILNPNPDDELDFPLEPVRRSPTRLFLPYDTSVSSFWIMLDLDHLGLEPMFHDEVLQALTSHVDGLVHGHGPQYHALITLRVNIKRVKRTPIFFPTEPLGRISTATGSRAVGFIPVAHPAPLDYDDYDDGNHPAPSDYDDYDYNYGNQPAPSAYDDYDYDYGNQPAPSDYDYYDYGSDDYVLKMLAVDTLETVTADDEERLLMEDAICSICLEELRVELDDEERSDGKAPMKLPCRHVFHDGCIRRWFKKSYFCPICRSSVFDKLAIEFSF